jgi:hypothetical protein
MHRRIGTLVVLGAALSPLGATATAALPPANPPAKRQAGVKVQWPLRDSESWLAVGSRLTVRVESAARRSEISLVRVSGNGRPMHVVARATRRSGSFSAVVPARIGATYALEIRIANRRFRSWVKSRVAWQAPAAQQRDPCPKAWGPMTLVLGSPTTVPSGSLAYTVSSPEGSCVNGVPVPQLSVLDADGRWRQYPPSGPSSLGPLIQGQLQKGWTRSASVLIPADAPTGHYRLTYGVAYRLPSGVLVPPAAEFDVVS